MCAGYPRDLARPVLLFIAALCTAWSTAFLLFTIPHAIWRPSMTQQHPTQHRIVRYATQQLMEKNPPSEWRMNVGHAIDVLRNDVVHLFDREPYFPDYSIFTEDIIVVDTRLPSFQLHGLDSYKQVLKTLRWSVGNAYEKAHLEITSLHVPVKNEIYMRWRLQLWPKDILASAKGLFAPLGSSNPFLFSSLSGMPFAVEGYSRYEFHPWSGKIVKHTIDITNPPMYITDLLQQHSLTSWWAHVLPETSYPRMELPGTLNSIAKSELLLETSQG